MDNQAQRNNINNSNTIFYVSFSVCLILYLSTYFIGSNEVASVADQIPEEVPVVKLQAKVKKVKRIVIVQPKTPKSYMYTNVLPALLDDLKISKECCTPEDVDNEEKHKIPPKAASRTNKKEPEKVMVVYIALGLLLMSLGAALLDFFRAKSEMKSNQGDGGKKKPALVRNCSLADLTVLRHTRKEMRRKESVQEAQKNWKVNRPQLRIDD